MYPATSDAGIGASQARVKLPTANPGNFEAIRNNSTNSRVRTLVWFFVAVTNKEVSDVSKLISEDKHFDSFSFCRSCYPCDWAETPKQKRCQSNEAASIGPTFLI